VTTLKEWREQKATARALTREDRLTPQEWLAVYKVREEEESGVFLEIQDIVSTEIQVQVGILAGAIDIPTIAREAANEIMCRFYVRRSQS
jgi:hypothetical protein